VTHRQPMKLGEAPKDVAFADRSMS
jgi:hypothetical protein